MLKRNALYILLCIVAAIGGITACNASDNAPTLASLKLLPAYSTLQDEALKKTGLDVAYFAGGCFWGTQSEFDSTKGVKETEVGYTGGRTKSPTYPEVCSHTTGHAETVRVVFDPKVISYPNLVKEFLKLHDPTTMNRQGPDIGDQYRSAIFFESDQQKKQAAEAIAEEQKTFTDGRKIVTRLENFSTFYTAEGYHQKYFARTGQASCHIRRM